MLEFASLYQGPEEDSMKGGVGNALNVFMSSWHSCQLTHCLRHSSFPLGTRVLDPKEAGTSAWRQWMVSQGSWRELFLSVKLRSPVSFQSFHFSMMRTPRLAWKAGRLLSEPQPCLPEVLPPNLFLTQEDILFAEDSSCSHCFPLSSRSRTK